MKKISIFLSATFLLLCLNLASAATTTDELSNLSSSISKINLNTATASQIQGTIKGLGEKRAEAIIDYRNQHGDYQSFEDLIKVSGISESFINTNLSLLKNTFSLE